MLDILLAHGSYIGIIVILLLTGMGLPIPEEIPIIAAGVLSSYGQLKPGLALASCLIGALLGDCLLYAIGYHFGHNLLKDHPWCARFLRPEREEQVEQLIRQHGLKVLFLARFLVGIRAPVYVAAGVLRVSFRRFFLVDCFCAAAVIGLFFGLSYAYGQQIAKRIRDVELAFTVAIVLVVLAAVIYFYRRHRRLVRLKRARLEESVRVSVSSKEPLGEEKTVA
ncbi:MAG: DedA family protein [Pirellulales bacterium]